MYIVTVYWANGEVAAREECATEAEARDAARMHRRHGLYASITSPDGVEIMMYS